MPSVLSDVFHYSCPTIKGVVSILQGSAPASITAIWLPETWLPSSTLSSTKTASGH